MSTLSDAVRLQREMPEKLLVDEGTADEWTRVRTARQRIEDEMKTARERVCEGFTREMNGNGASKEPVGAERAGSSTSKSDARS